MSQNPTWASTNNSILICPKCAHLHQSLGETISIVKSLEVSNFTEHEITVMKIGGNKRLSSLLDEYKIPNTIQKYNTKIAHYYRKLLEIEGSFLEGNNPNEQYQQLLQSMPTLEYGSELVETADSQENVIDSHPPAYTVHEGVEEDFKTIKNAVGGILGWFGSAFHTTAEFIGIDKKLMETKEEINKKLSNIEVNPNLKDAGTKMVEAMKKSTYYVSNKVAETEAFKSMTHGVDQGYLSIKQTLTNIIKPFNPNDDNTNNSSYNSIIHSNDISNMNEININDNIESLDNAENNDCNAPPIKSDNDCPGFININKSDY